MSEAAQQALEAWVEWLGLLSRLKLHWLGLYRDYSPKAQTQEIQVTGVAQQDTQLSFPEPEDAHQGPLLTPGAEAKAGAGLSQQTGPELADFETEQSVSSSGNKHTNFTASSETENTVLILAVQKQRQIFNYHPALKYKFY